MCCANCYQIPCPPTPFRRPRSFAPPPATHPLPGALPVNLPTVQLTSQQRTEKYGLTEAATSRILAQEIEEYCRFSRELIQLDRFEGALQGETTTGHTSHIR